MKCHLRVIFIIIMDVLEMVAQCNTIRMRKLTPDCVRV